MRRERILKVCANHLIKPDMKIEFRADDKTGKILTWRAQDYTDDTPRLEQFCCKFKTEEMAQDFKKHFEEAVKTAVSSPVKAKPVETLGSSEVSSTSAPITDQARPFSSSDAPLNLSNKQEPAESVTPKTSVLAGMLSTETEPKQGGGIFGTFTKTEPSSTTGNLFGLPKPAVSGMPGSIFGAGTSQTATLTGTNEKSSTVFGGFTFSQKPTIQDTRKEEVTKPKATEEKKVEEKKSNPFAGFSFGSPASTSDASKSVFGGSNAASVGFGDIAKTGSSLGFGEKTSETKGFAGTGAPVFGAKDSPTKEKGADDGEYEPEVDFKPIVTLPEVETKTGEEDEEKLFCQRAKLYRFDKEAKQWKERGVGELKILQHRSTDKCRLLMRREQVLKICANHIIQATMTITPMASSDKTYQWACNDFSENEVKHEMFAAKFKTSDLAEEFKNTFEECVKKAIETSTVPLSEIQESAVSSSIPETVETVEEEIGAEEEDDDDDEYEDEDEVTTDESPSDDEGHGFKAQYPVAADMNSASADDWECQQCYVRNKKECPSCVACDIPRAGSEAEQKPASMSLAEQFARKDGEWECELCYVRNKAGAILCAACETPKPGCEDAVKQEKAKSSSAAAAKFGFGSMGGAASGSATSGFSFGASAGGGTSFSTSSGATPKFGFGFDATKAGTSSTTSAPVFGGAAPSLGSGLAPKFGFGFGTTDVKAASSESSENKPFAFGSGATTKESTVSENKPTFGFAFGTPSTTTPSFGSLAAQVKDDKASTPPSKGFAFNVPKDSPEKASSTVESTPVSTKSEQAQVTSTTSSSSTFGSGQFKFDGLSTEKIESKSFAKSPVKSPGGEDGYYEDDDGAHIHFEPIVELPTNYEHKTGEEDEEVIYTQRAKLFRFTDGQWKERGIGDIKLLKHRSTQKLRLVMRREQVFRICLNQYVTEQMVLRDMAGGKEKAFTWFADDFSDGELSHENLAIKFKTPEIAAHFKKVIDTVKVGKHLPDDLKQAPQVVPESPTLAQATTPIKSPDGKAEVTSSTAVSESSSLQSFTFQSPTTTTPSSTPSFSKFEFKAPTFGPGVFSSGPKANVFGTNSPATSVPFAFGGTKSTQSVVTDTPKSGKASTVCNATSLLSVLEGETKQSTTSAAAERAKSALDSKQSLLRTLLADDASSGTTGFSALRSAIEGGDAVDDDVIFVSERTPTKEQEERAKQLMLPRHFFMYEDADAPQCPGCRGCNPDSFDFDSIGKENETESTISATQVQQTGDRGNVHYSAQLDSKSQEPTIVASTSQSTGDRGNIHYANELSQQDSEPAISASVSQTTGDKGNLHYAKELNQQQSASTSGSIFGSAAFTPATPGSSISSGAGTSDGALFSNILRKADTSVGFADLAKQSPESATNSGFAFGKKTDDSKPFAWQGAGASVFGASPTKAAEGGGDADDVEQGPDVHFEPIVSLPEVETVTGEEDEEVLFCARSKLYRFVTTEKEQAWKERGVGEVKILKHRRTGKFRILQRRDKILKISANHYITKDMKLMPMQTSETTWCWNAMDFAENEARNEQLAMKFKNKELATEFKTIFERCQEELANGPESSEASQAEETSSQEADVSAAGGASDVANAASVYQEEEDAEEEEQVQFEKRVTMHVMDDHGSPKDSTTGELKVLYDDDVNGYRIIMTSDQGHQFCNHIICRKYVLQKSSKKKFAEWTAKDFVTDDPTRKTFRVNFSSAPALNDFVDAFRQGVELAKDSELDEVADSVSITGEILRPEVVSHPANESEA